jgi:transposase
VSNGSQEFKRYLDYASRINASYRRDYLTAKQVADRLHVKVATIYEWTRRREKNPISNYPISRKVVLSKWSEVVDWIEAQRVAA